MKLHLLLTPEINSKIPSTAKITDSWGQLTIIINGDMKNTERGLHCFVEDESENLISWLIQFNEIIVGSGSPQLESFTFFNPEEFRVSVREKRIKAIEKRIFKLFDVIDKNHPSQLSDEAHKELKDIKNDIGEMEYDKIITPKPIENQELFNPNL